MSFHGMELLKEAMQSVELNPDCILQGHQPLEDQQACLASLPTTEWNQQLFEAASYLGN